MIVAQTVPSRSPNGTVNIVVALFLLMICAITGAVWLRLNDLDARLHYIEGLAAERGEKFRQSDRQLSELYNWMMTQRAQDGEHGGRANRE